MGPIGRLKRCALLLEPARRVRLYPPRPGAWEFDMLATLRRAGSPFIPPHPAFSTLMTSGTMTHRLKALENGVLLPVYRILDDARSLLVALTGGGADGSMRLWKATRKTNASCWPDSSMEQRQQLDRALKVFMRLLEELPATGSNIPPLALIGITVRNSTQAKEERRRRQFLPPAAAISGDRHPVQNRPIVRSRA